MLLETCTLDFYLNVLLTRFFFRQIQLFFKYYSLLPGLISFSVTRRGSLSANTDSWNFYKMWPLATKWQVPHLSFCNCKAKVPAFLWYLRVLWFVILRFSNSSLNKDFLGTFLVQISIADITMIYNLFVLCRREVSSQSMRLLWS